MEDESQTAGDRGIDRCHLFIKGDQNPVTGTDGWKDREGCRKITANEGNAASNGEYGIAFLLPRDIW